MAFLKSKTVTIRVEHQTRMLKLSTDSADTMRLVRKRIFNKWPIPPGQHYLKSYGQKININNSVLSAWKSVQPPTMSQSKLTELWRDLQVWDIVLVAEDSALPEVEEPNQLKLIEAKDIPNIESIPWPAEKVVDAVNDQRKVVFDLSQKGRILEDSEDTLRMIESAENADWSDVFDILEQKPYIINAIPADKSWSVLHQAVYQDNCDVVEKLLSMKGCDPEIKAKQDTDEEGWPGMTPLEFAQKRQSKCTGILLNHNTSVKVDDMTFVSAERGKALMESGVPYYNMAAAFLGPDRLRTLNLNGQNFYMITREMHGLICEDWEFVRDTVRQSLYPFEASVAEFIGEVNSTRELKKALITIYTGVSIYRQCNAALRRAEADIPHGDDLLVSLYSLFFLSVLLHDEDLKIVTEPTYRGLYLSQKQAEMYQGGRSFHWLSFTSTTLDESMAVDFMQTCATPNADQHIPTLFIIDNSNKSIWSPKDVAKYSCYTHEREALLPSGAKFIVRKVLITTQYMEYHIDLTS